MLPKQMLYNFLDNVPDLSRGPLNIVTRDQLILDDLIELFNQKTAAIHIPNYFGSSLAEKMAPILKTLSPIKRYDLPLGEGKKRRTDVNYGVGFPKRIAFTSEKLKAKYYRESVNTIAKVRSAFSPALSPIDKLRLEMDEIWPHGAGLVHTENGTELAGTLRQMNPIKKGLIHIDDYYRRNTRRSFSACFYFKVPKKGGELEIWDISLSSKNRKNPLFTVINTFDKHTQAYIRNRLPEPRLIKPKAGDLILFDAGRPHAVAGFESDERIVLQLFLSYYGKSKPLRYFS